MDNKDIRWIQRFSNFNKAIKQLEKAVQLAEMRDLSDLEEQGLIQAFEYTHELAWNVMKDYFEYQGNTALTGSRDAIQEAFNKGLITDGKEWMDTIRSRNKSSHTYNEGTAREIAEKIINNYIKLFKAFQDKMEELRAGMQTDLFSEL